MIQGPIFRVHSVSLGVSILLKPALTTIDLGVAPEKFELCKDGEITVTGPMGYLKSGKDILKVD
ncbi:hypothetical protein LguiA_008099 [Lonicera macranthoides]